MVLLTANSTPTLKSLVYDVLFRPAELENIPMWDQFAQYDKVRLKKKGSKPDSDDEDENDNEDEDEGNKNGIFDFTSIYKY